MNNLVGMISFGATAKIHEGKNRAGQKSAKKVPLTPTIDQRAEAKRVERQTAYSNLFSSVSSSNFLNAPPLKKGKNLIITGNRKIENQTVENTQLQVNRGNLIIKNAIFEKDAALSVSKGEVFTSDSVFKSKVRIADNASLSQINPYNLDIETDRRDFYSKNIISGLKASNCTMFNISAEKGSLSLTNNCKVKGTIYSSSLDKNRTEPQSDIKIEDSVFNTIDSLNPMFIRCNRAQGKKINVPCGLISISNCSKTKNGFDIDKISSVSSILRVVNSNIKEIEFAQNLENSSDNQPYEETKETTIRNLQYGAIINIAGNSSIGRLNVQKHPTKIVNSAVKNLESKGDLMLYNSVIGTANVSSDTYITGCSIEHNIISTAENKIYLFTTHEARNSDLKEGSITYKRTNVKGSVIAPKAALVINNNNYSTPLIQGAIKVKNLELANFTKYSIRKNDIISGRIIHSSSWGKPPKTFELTIEQGAKPPRALKGLDKNITYIIKNENTKTISITVKPGSDFDLAGYKRPLGYDCKVTIEKANNQQQSPAKPTALARNRYICRKD